MGFLYKDYPNSFLATFISMISSLLCLAAVLVLLLGFFIGNNISETILFVVGGICFGISGIGAGWLARHIASKKEETVGITPITEQEEVVVNE